MLSLFSPALVALPALLPAPTVVPHDVDPLGTASVAEPADAPPPVREALTVEVLERSASTLQVRVTGAGGPRVLDLEPTSARAEDFQLLIQGPDGTYVLAEPPPSRTFRGTVAGEPGSAVVASLVDGALTATVSASDGPWSIEPGRGAEGSHVLVRGGSAPAAAATPAGVGGPASAVAGLRVCELALDTDVELFNALGSVDDVVERVELLLAGAREIYERDVSITFELTALVVRTAEPDPYTSTSAATTLDQLVTEWNTNLAFIERDQLHLIMGRDVSQLVSLAYIQGICSSTDAGISEHPSLLPSLTYRIALLSFTLGITWGAQTCNVTVPGCNLMCSPIGSCGEPTQFGPAAVAQILGYAATVGCVPTATAGGLPFAESFESGNLIPTVWPAGTGADVTGAGGAADGLMSLRLAGNPVTDAFVRSTSWDLSAESSLAVSLEVRRVAREAGETLAVEYAAPGGEWRELLRVRSDGTNDGAFVHYETALPAAAYHDSFSLRLRTDSDALDDSWFIDDVRLETKPCPSPARYCDALPSSVSASGAPIYTHGTTSIGANDFGLYALDVPANQFGVFYYGPDQAALAFGNGLRCVGGTTVRLPVVAANAVGTAELALDLTDLPPNGPIGVGDTWNFQFWYRDPAGSPASFNLSDGVTTTWCP